MALHNVGLVFWFSVLFTLWPLPFTNYSVSKLEWLGYLVSFILGTKAMIYIKYNFSKNNVFLLAIATFLYLMLTAFYHDSTYNEFIFLLKNKAIFEVLEIIFNINPLIMPTAIYFDFILPVIFSFILFIYIRKLRRMARCQQSL